MPPINEKIARAAWEALFGRYSAYQTTPGYCLAFVRRVLETALGKHDGWLYQHAVTEWVQPAGYERDFGHWARDAERSLRNLGMILTGDRPRAGDLVFNYDTAEVSPGLWREYFPERAFEDGVNIGHVGIVLEHGTILENVKPSYRPHSVHHGALALTPAHVAWEPTSVIRFDESRIRG